MTVPDLLDRQKRFFESGATRGVQWRKNQLKALRSLIIGRRDELASAVRADFNKPEFESQGAELLLAVHEIDLHLKNLETWNRPQRVNGNNISFPSKNRVYRIPYGVTLIIGSWNYPLNLLLHPLAGSISGGNCTVVKPSEKAPCTSALLAEYISQTFPPEYIAAVEGGSGTGIELSEQPFDKIFFTGSRRTGMAIMEKAAGNLTPVTLELGGKSPVIVHRDADPSRAARRILWGKCLNAGQTCIAPDFLLLHESLKSPFLQHAAGHIRQFFGEKPKQSGDYTRIINRESFRRITRLIEGTEILLGGGLDEEELYIEPTLVDPGGWSHKIMQEEIFGPVLPVITYRDRRELFSHLRQNPAPLALYLFTKSKDLTNEIVQKIPHGGSCINDVMLNFTNLNLPFGGTGSSGMGSYHGRYSFECFTRPHGVMDRTSWIDLPFRYPPYRDKLKLLKRFFLR